MPGVNWVELGHTVVDACMILSGQTRPAIPKSIIFITFMVRKLPMLKVGDTPRTGI